MLGYHAARAALTSRPRRVERLMLAAGRRDARTRELVGLAKEHGVPFRQVPSEALDRASGGEKHQGIAAKMAGCDLLPTRELVDALPSNALAVVLDGVEDPRNVGAIARTAVAAGANGLFLPEWRSAGVSPGATRTAAGAFDLLAVARAGNTNRLLEVLTDAGVSPVALATEGGKPPWSVDWTGAVALVAGGEARGVRRSVLEHCAERVTIPIREAIGSLNVSVAVGMVLSELLRQRSGVSEA